MKFKEIIAIITGLSFIVGTAYAVDNHFAKQQEHLQLAQAFQQYVNESRSDKLQERIWDLEDKLASKPSPSVKTQLENRLRELKFEKTKVMNKIDEGNRPKF